MSLFVYCPRKSQGALELVHALGGIRLRKFDGIDFWSRRRRLTFSEKDVIICWGASIPEIDGPKILNSRLGALNKYEEWLKMAIAEVPTIRCFSAKEIGTAARGLANGFLPRTFQHQGGADLINVEGVRADFWAQKETFIQEFRVHSFAGKSIRAGVKVPREGFRLLKDGEEWKPNAGLAHPWVRSFDVGWKLSYDGFKSTAAMRTLAASAVKALDLTFGGVDIGKTATGALKVIELNQAPGCEGGTVEAYVKAIKRWVDGQEQEVEEGDGKAEETVEPVKKKRKAALVADRMRGIANPFEPEAVRVPFPPADAAPANAQVQPARPRGAAEIWLDEMRRQNAAIRARQGDV